MADATKPMEGIWTLTAPDGRTWQAETPLRCVRDEQAERVPATLRLQRIMEAAAEPATDPAYEALRRLHDWALAQQGDCMFSGDHPIAQAAVVLGGVPTKVPPSHEWLRMNAPEKHAEWVAGNLKPATVDWMAGWDACRAQSFVSHELPRWRWVDCTPHAGYFERRADGEWVKWADLKKNPAIPTAPTPLDPEAVFQAQSEAAYRAANPKGKPWTHLAAGEWGNWHRVVMAVLSVQRNAGVGGILKDES